MDGFGIPAVVTILSYKKTGIAGFFKSDEQPLTRQ